MRWPAFRAGFLGLLIAQTAFSQTESSFSDSVLEFQEAKLTLQSAASEIADLHKRLALNDQTVKRLSESLAVANGEAEYFRNQAFELKLRLEALGLESVGDDESKRQGRLLQAVRDLQVVQEEKDRLATQLIEMSESILRYLSNAETTDFEARLDIETQLRKASEVLGYIPANVERPAAAPASLLDAAVMSIKEDLSLVVINIGSRHGVKYGAMFRVVRGEKSIAKVQVVDVREAIAGAVIQELDLGRERVRVGDRLRLDTQQ